MELAAAVTNAVKFCEDNHILQPFLADHASEVFNMLTTEFKMEDAIAVWKEEGREEGIVIGESRVLSLIESGCSLEEIKELLRNAREGNTE